MHNGQSRQRDRYFKIANRKRKKRRDRKEKRREKKTHNGIFWWRPLKF
jgi:hypothetical protein